MTVNSIDDKFLVEDIIVLYEINKRPTHFNNPIKAFSGHHHHFRDKHQFINIVKVVKKLLNKGLIRESTPQELLPVLTNSDLQEILKGTGNKTYGTKAILIKRIKEFVSDEDICQCTDKSFFVLTELGVSILEKFKNVIWIYLHGDNIFEESFISKSKFTENYFLTHWKLDPAKEIIDYYLTKNSGIVANVYQVEKDAFNSFYYFLKYFTERLSKQLIHCKEKGAYYSPYSLSALNWNLSAIFNNNLSMTDDQLEYLLQEIYSNSILEKSLINFNKYKKLINSILDDKGDPAILDMITKLFEEIRISFGHNIESNTRDAARLDDEIEVEYSIYEALHLMYNDDDKIESLILELLDDVSTNTLIKLKEKLNAILP